MRVASVVISVFFTVFAFHALGGEPPHKTLALWYRQPAHSWNEALPIGNGRMGAMVYGGAATEHYQLNEQTLWSGGPRDWNNPDALKYLPLVRDAAIHGRYREADSISRFMQGPYTESYLPMADLFISHRRVPDSSRYKRVLDLDSAKSTVQFGSGVQQEERSAFASFPDKVIVIRETAAAMSFTATLRSELHYRIVRLANNHIVLRGTCPAHVEPRYLWKIPTDKALQYDSAGSGMRFEVHLLITSPKGIITADSNGITVTDSRECLLLVSAATSYNGYDHSPGLQGVDPSVKASEQIQAAATHSYSQLLARHTSDYRHLFSRVNYDLGDNAKFANEPTDVRLKKMKDRSDPAFAALVAQYGRYLLISSSREGGQPANLKGLWNDRLRPEYSSNWCIDHDAQMFYYAAETSNLSETHLPFLDLIRGLADNGRRTAAINYGMPGWCAHHNTDLWRQTGPVGGYGGGNPHWATWNMSAPWLCAHLYDHFLFTGDTAFLRDFAWPIMKSAADFCHAWLIRDAAGRLMSVPSVSPENTFITAEGDTAMIATNSTGDLALIGDLYRNCIASLRIIDPVSHFIDTLRSDLQLLPPYKRGSKGQLLEWDHEWRSVDPSHRHLTHLYPAFPGSEFSLLKTPDWIEAAKGALNARARTNCTWGFVLKAACWARTGEGDSAWASWQEQLRFVDPQSKSPVENYGLYPNLFNSDAPDVIMNGNACATAVLTEMLLQSHGGFLYLLPALPGAFRQGACSGLRARGGFEVSLKWKDHHLQTASIKSLLGDSCTFYTRENTISVSLHGKLVSINKHRNGSISFATAKNNDYVIRVAGRD